MVLLHVGTKAGCRDTLLKSCTVRRKCSAASAQVMRCGQNRGCETVAYACCALELQSAFKKKHLCVALALFVSTRPDKRSVGNRIFEGHSRRWLDTELSRPSSDQLFPSSYTYTPDKEMSRASTDPPSIPWKKKRTTVNCLLPVPFSPDGNSF